MERSSSFKTHDPERFLFAVPKKGRLYNKCLKLLEGAGIDFFRPNRLDIAQCSSLPLTLVFLPAKDIGLYVSEGMVDMGITGEDIIQESGADVNLVLKLGLGKCKLCLQAPVPHKIKSAEDLVGKRIVTSFTKLAKEYFDKFPNGETTKINYVSGSVEAACGLGLADGIVDLVETGTTMRAAGLEVVETIMSTQSVLISNKKTRHIDMIEKLKKRFESYQMAMKYDMMLYNVSAKNLDEAKKITPGMKAPTIMELSSVNDSDGEDDKWYAIQVMVLKKDTGQIMDDLSDLGATGILVMEIKNCRTSAR
jgi:ATP phosphoribosyltransferase